MLGILGSRSADKLGCPRPYSKTITEVRQALQTAFDEIYAWFDQPEEVRRQKPADGGWSINEILEPITLTTHFLMIIVRNGYPKAIKRASNQNVVDAPARPEENCSDWPARVVRMDKTGTHGAHGRAAHFRSARPHAPATAGMPGDP